METSTAGEITFARTETETTASDGETIAASDQTETVEITEELRDGTETSALTLTTESSTTPFTDLRGKFVNAQLCIELGQQSRNRCEALSQRLIKTRVTLFVAARFAYNATFERYSFSVATFAYGNCEYVSESGLPSGLAAWSLLSSYQLRSFVLFVFSDQPCHLRCRSLRAGIRDYRSGHCQQWFVALPCSDTHGF